MCRKCRSHGVAVRLQGHTSCPYTNCCCAKCYKAPVSQISRTKQQQQRHQQHQHHQRQQRGYAPNPQYLKLGVDGYAPAMVYAPGTMPGRHAVGSRGMARGPQVSLR